MSNRVKKYYFFFIYFRMRAESVTSAKSRTSTRDRYRVKSKTSDVDETLFASPTKRKAHAPPKKETVQVSFYIEVTH